MKLLRCILYRLSKVEYIYIKKGKLKFKKVIIKISINTNLHIIFVFVSFPYLQNLIELKL